METKDALYGLRTKKGLSQEELAEKVFVTRQAVSRWETGETVPNTETLKLLSKFFGVSINTLLGSPRKLICQCCGMPLEDGIISREKDGTPNEDYCEWCYADGGFTYGNMDDLIDVCVKNMASEQFPAEAAREYMKNLLPTLAYWKGRGKAGDGETEKLKQALIDECNALGIAGMPKVEKLYALVGRYVNLTYPLPSGTSAAFLDDQKTYFGCQVEGDGGRCFGMIGSGDFLLVSSYGEGGSDPELILYKKR
ncbi:MAG: helix-turn-helix domain-containing protein [Clostridia bacterium]|nr:helix-turn-helix domain-containing protein [Clostridia bacterium]